MNYHQKADRRAICIVYIIVHSIEKNINQKKKLPDLVFFFPQASVRQPKTCVCPQWDPIPWMCRLGLCWWGWSPPPSLRPCWCALWTAASCQMNGGTTHCWVRHTDTVSKKKCLKISIFRTFHHFGKYLFSCLWLRWENESYYKDGMICVQFSLASTLETKGKHHYFHHN